MKSVPISVAMPVFNSEIYLLEAIKSIQNQQFEDFEFIIVDDGSTDNSGAVIEEAARTDNRIKYLRQENSGISTALNKALAEAKGKYFARMDADDVSLPDRLVKQYLYMESHPRIIGLGGQGYIIDGDGDLICPLPVLTDHDAIDDDLLNYFNRKAMIHSSVMLRTDEVRKIDGYNQEYLVAEDLDLFLRLAEIGELANLNSLIVYYRRHGNAISDKRKKLMRSSAMRAANEARRRRHMPIVEYVEDTTPEATPTCIEHMYSMALSALSNDRKLTASKYFKKMVFERGLTVQSAKLFLKIAAASMRNRRTP